MGRKIGLAAAMALAGLLAGCGDPKPPQYGVKDPEMQADANDASSRAFSGKLLSLDTMRGRIRIVIDDQVPPGNIICRYDRETKFYLDGQATTLDKLMEAFAAYMPVRVKGKVEKEFFRIEAMKVSSAVPMNAPATGPATGPGGR